MGILKPSVRKKTDKQRQQDAVLGSLENCGDECLILDESVFGRVPAPHQRDQLILIKIKIKFADDIDQVIQGHPAAALIIQHSEDVENFAPHPPTPAAQLVVDRFDAHDRVQPSLVDIAQSELQTICVSNK